MLTYRLLRAAGALALVVAGAAACGGGSSLPPVSPMAADTSPGARTLRPGDVIKVQVFGHDELTGDFTVDENANLLLPIVGEFSVRDMSVTDLRARIRREFGQLYTQSFVSVVPMFRVSVLGEVAHPGLYSVDPTLNIYEVLATAGGTTRNAAENHMRLIRNGQAVAAPVSTAALARATLREIGVRSGDQIIVPRRSITYETWLVGLQVLNLVLISYSVFRK